MKNMGGFKGKRAKGGFTIIELIVVILLLGILSATALPRFIDVTDDAHAAAVQGVLGGLSTGVALFRAQWTADGQPATGATITQFANKTADGLGYPLVANNTVADCVSTWNSVLQGGRPTISTGAVSNPFSNPISSYANTFQAASSGTTCYYIYTARGATFSSPVITYNSITGDVELSGSQI